MRVFLTVVLFALVGAVAQADTLARTADRTIARSDFKDSKKYGNCNVITGVDMFTDEETHYLSCNGGPAAASIHIIYTSRTGFMVVLNPGRDKGYQSHLDDYISVSIRVDKETPIHSSAEWDGKSGEAYIQDDQLARWLLDGLAHGQRLAIQVGDKSGKVWAGMGYSSKLIADFRQRAGLQTSRP